MKDLTKGNILKGLITFTLPLLLGNFFQVLYNTADTLIVGQTLGKNALASVGATGSINFLIVGFAQGMTEGQEQGFSEGHQQGFAEGRRQGYTEGSLAGQQEGRKQFVEAAQPLEAITGKVNDFLAHIERKQREDLLQLVEKVTRQVIRCELALQPTQLLALVEEALAAFPAMPETLQVMLSTEEFNRLRDAVPEKVSEWGLTPSPDLPPGECRVITDKSELDIGCEHRLEQCMTALKETLTPESQGE